MRSLREALEHAQSIASNTLLLLSGDAGTGKTHLLCDIAKERIGEGRPTVLLMGQRFVSSDEPWSQVLHQLDLAGLSAEEFVGALEAAAQTNNCRALVIIDALNEGAGRRIWPNHLEAFLAHLERSPWIGVVLAVRSSYEEIVIPEQVHARAFNLTHYGFAEHEYDATRTFFAYYELELPSTPLLAPEFRNPLFLKTLCRGLNIRRERRVPRGYHGITAIFGMFLGAINDRLASELSFNRKTPLVHQAIQAFAKAIVDVDCRWLPLARAEEVINTLLPGRDFEHSLYRGLIAEGLLLEESIWSRNGIREEAVLIAYERFADHLVAKALLDTHMDNRRPAAAFEAGAPLAFLCDFEQNVSHGLLEALCIQIPERTGRELTELAPAIKDRWNIGKAFRRSLIWRDPQAFSDATREDLNKLSRTYLDRDDAIDVLLTVATIPGHPFNATFLDRRLRRDSMPSRDSWWSVYLHRTWKTHGAVDRLIEWASAVTPHTTLDDETVDLCSTALAWMLTASNRFLRDGATKALVSLLTGRLQTVERLVENFADVNDLYVAERVYAVAYGAAMRSNDPVQIGALATCVYRRAFASGVPPAHVLLRDYARGVVERALYVGARIDVIVDRIRPPYQSTWPIIPGEGEIKLLPDWSHGDYDSGTIEWSRNRIISSVMSDDFARYVIGTNSWSTSWLSLPLGKPVWQSPSELFARLHENFSAEEILAWEEFKVVDDRFRFLSSTSSRLVLTRKGAAEESKRRKSHLAQAKKDRNRALVTLKLSLTAANSQALEVALSAEKSCECGRNPPGFDLGLIQRYVLWRVFDLGWSTQLFGHFDRFEIGYQGREATKAERIGKKYQWIAYHEIMALVADHFQYREKSGEGEHSYCGPWQEHLRDIDPSCTLRATRGGTYLGSHAPAWWGAASYEDWYAHQGHLEWVKRYDDLPRMEGLLSVVYPEDNSRWVNMRGHFSWEQQPPADLDWRDVDRREIWYISTGYLVQSKDVPAFLQWAEGVEFGGRWMPGPSEMYRMFLGEHGWSPASHYFQQRYFGDEGWAYPDQGCPVQIRVATVEYLRELSGLDCSIDDSYTLRLPVNDLVGGLSLQWNGCNADFVDTAGQLSAFDPTAGSEGPSALLLHEERLRSFVSVYRPASSVRLQEIGV